jgi:sugar lactone lactonase YvrE
MPKARLTICILIWFSVATWNTVAADYLLTLAGSALVDGNTDAVGRDARFSDPAGLVFDHLGNLFVADNRNHTIRRIAPSGEVSTVAGHAGTAGASNGTGLAARFDSPTGLAIDSSNNLYVADTGNHLIRRITPAGEVTVWAGRAGQSGSTDGAAGQALFNNPLGLAVGRSNEVYVSDSGNHTIRKITADGQVTTLAGRARVWGSADGVGTAARFNNPIGLTLDQYGNVYVSDASNFTIRKISPEGEVSTLAGMAGEDGSVDASGTAARFGKPAELACDAHGCVFLADSFNHVIRKIESTGQVVTIAGFAGEDGQADGPGQLARFFNPYGLALDANGNLFISDAYNQTVRLMLIPFTVTLIRSAQDTQTQIKWEAVAGRRYQVQYREQAGAGSWRNLGNPVTAATATATQNDSESGPSQRYYRVMLVEQ